MTSANSAVELRVICAGGFKTAMLEIAPRLEAKGRHKLAVSFGTPQRNRELISAGTGFDVVVVTSNTLADSTRPHIAEAGRFEVAMSPVGMGVREGVSAPDVTTLDSFAAAVRAVGSIGLSDPTSGTTLANDIMAAARTVGLDGEIERRKRYFVGPGSVVSVEVGKGNADAVMTLTTEIVGTPGVRYLGPLPAELNLGTRFTAAASTARAADPAAQSFLAFLRTEEARAIMRAKGLAVL
jgi:molybdate transport system substrate-binding protein